MRDTQSEELELFFTDIDPEGTQNSVAMTVAISSRHVLITISTVIVVHLALLFIMHNLNSWIMFSFAIDDFPLLRKVNPLIVASGQFLFSGIVLFPFCWRQFLHSFQTCIGGVCLTTIPYIASISSSLTISYFFNPPPYFQIRSFSITCAFFFGFFNRHFYNFPDTLIAVSLMICGTLLSSGPSTEFYFPFLIFGFASSIASVQYPFGIRKSLPSFRKKLVLMAFSLNFCSFCIATPFALIYADFSILRAPQFRFINFVETLAVSGLVAAILCITTSVVIYFASPLHYVAISSVRSSLHILFQAFLDPVRRVLTPGMFLGHLLCVSSGTMVVLFHLDKVRHKTAVPWSFPMSLWRLLGFAE
jgi:hypothetical protein